jgi:hypothetical protein
METKLAATLVFALLQVQANGPTPAGQVERATVFAIQQEIQAGHIEKRRDVCVAFGPEAGVHAKEVISELRRKNFKIHTNDWCNIGPRGMKINMIGSVMESSPRTYEFVVELGDLSGIQKGKHFGTLLRRGAYVIECRDGADPKLVEY